MLEKQLDNYQVLTEVAMQTDEERAPLSPPVPARSSVTMAHPTLVCHLKKVV
jgi:hypothetical protein